jgi:hypothetical protein
MSSAAILRGIFAKRRWPGLPMPESSVPSINSAVLALNERSRVQGREQGDILASFTTVQYMITIGVVDASGKTLEQRVADIEARLEAAGIP